MSCGLRASSWRPLSDLGAVSYYSYWTRTVLNVIKRHEGAISIKDLSDMTAIKQDDIILQRLNRGLDDCRFASLKLEGLPGLAPWGGSVRSGWELAPGLFTLSTGPEAPPQPPLPLRAAGGLDLAQPRTG